MLTRDGWAFLVITGALLIIALWLGYPEVLFVALALLMYIVFAGVWLLLRPQVEVSREVLPPRVSEGDGAAGVLTVKNVGGRRCPPMLAVEHVVDRAIAIPLPGLAPGATHVANYMLSTDRRGCYAVGPLRIGHSDPLRLVNLTQTLSAEATLWVHPLVHRVSPIPTGHSQELEGPTSLGAPRGGIAFHSLREYQPGDEPRLIHWRSTARTGTLMVRHTVITNEPRLLIVLDTSAEPYADDSFEDAVRVAASLMAAGVEKRFPTELRTTGGIAASIDPTGLGRTDALDKLAAVQVGVDDPGLDELIRMAARREQGVSLGVVTGQPPVAKANAVGAVRDRFEVVTLIQVGERFGRPGIGISGVLGVSASTSAEWALTWKSRIG